MVNLDEQLQNLQKKLLHFAKEYQSLLQENKRLKNEVDTSKKKLRETNSQLEVLQRQTDAVKLGNLVLNDADKKNLQKRIDIYLKEIEKCLQIINE